MSARGAGTGRKCQDALHCACLNEEHSGRPQFESGYLFEACGALLPASRKNRVPSGQHGANEAELRAARAAWLIGMSRGKQLRGPHLVVEIAVEPQDVWVAQVALDFNLPAQLVLNVRLLELVLQEAAHKGPAVLRMREK